MKILIPAYEPDLKLINLVKELKDRCDFGIVIVDDGSGKKYDDIFNELKNQGCIVLRHLVNFGKGNALKTGIRYIIDSGESEGIVTADSDGQHLPEDIIIIASKVNDFKEHIILGSRYFKGKIPFKSRFGNSVTRRVFYFTTGRKIYDTQTGLRGFSSEMFEWLLNIQGERFEYEMNMLLEAENEGFGFYEVEIKTIYHKQHSTHFRAIEDSVRIYMPIIKFSISSLSAGFIDYVLLFLMHGLTGNLLISAVIARVCSSTFNYSINRIFVFSKGKNCKIKNSMLKYFVLVLIVLTLNYGLLYFYFEKVHIHLFFAKILTEVTIFVFSYWMQRKFVFKPQRKLFKKCKKKICLKSYIIK